MSRLAQLTYSMIHDCVDAMIAKTLTGTIVSWNSSAERLFGYTEQEALGHSILTIVPPELAGEESAILERLAQGQHIQDLHTYRLNKHGQRLPVTMTISPLRDRDGQVIGASTIVRERLNVADNHPELLRLAYQDPLTSISNRTHLLDRLEQAMRRNERTHHYGAIFFIDLDNFKQVNDSASHAAGDHVLKKCARRMQAILREYDTVARWGGDEFIAMVEELDVDREAALDKARSIATKLLRALRKPYTYKGRSFTCHPSIGLTIFRGVIHPLQQVIDVADQAMYQAKLAGKNGIHVISTQANEAIATKPSQTVAA
jgi:diguanylate cyclase (GGDEF)-like protein/PAS domain S-box-containing protein